MGRHCEHSITTEDRVRTHRNTSGPAHSRSGQAVLQNSLERSSYQQGHALCVSMCGETKVSTAEGRSEGRLQPQSEGRSGFTHLHQTLQKCHWPQAMAKRLGRSLSILVPGSRKAISLPRWHSYELYLPRCKGCTPAHSGFPPN